MKFSYDSYLSFIELIRQHRYSFASYINWRDFDKCVILRHDIDYDMKKAFDMAYIEADAGVRSTYFVLLTSDFYNIFSKQNADMLQKILSFGHDIGLHFDEVRYPECISTEAIKEKIIYEAEVLEKVIGSKINAVSMHRPSKLILESDLKIDGLINSYGSTFFKEFKYLSDSRCRWREPAEEIIESEEFNRLQILTHAFWYDEEEHDIHDNVCSFVNRGNSEKYDFLLDNITDLQSIMSREEVVV